MKGSQEQTKAKKEKEGPQDAESDDKTGIFRLLMPQGAGQKTATLVFWKGLALQAGITALQASRLYPERYFQSGVTSQCPKT